MSIEAKPYVVSADLHGVLNGWKKSPEGKAYTIPTKPYIDAISENLGSILIDTFPGTTVEIVSEDEIRNGINQLVRGSKYPVVSLDRAYIDDDVLKTYLLGHLDVTRAVGEDFEKIGLVSREGFPPLDIQIQRIASTHTGPVALVDDVVYSGNDLVEKDGVFEKMRGAGIPVSMVIAGIGVGEGVQKVRSQGVDVVSVREYVDVEDEVCKRDFFACVPMSGSMLIAKDGRIWSAPYFRPFGDPKKRASIPVDKIPEFSRSCIVQSIELWKEIERLSQASILTEATPRHIRELKKGISVVKALQEHLDRQSYLE